MWSLYGRLSESVAIETTVGALRSVLSKRGDIRIERMRYTPASGTIFDLRDLYFEPMPDEWVSPEFTSLLTVPNLLETAA